MGGEEMEIEGGKRLRWDRGRMSLSWKWSRDEVGD